MRCFAKRWNSTEKWSVWWRPGERGTGTGGAGREVRKSNAGRGPWKWRELSLFLTVGGLCG